MYVHVNLLVFDRFLLPVIALLNPACRVFVVVIHPCFHIFFFFFFLLFSLLRPPSSSLVRCSLDLSFVELSPGSEIPGRVCVRVRACVRACVCVWGGGGGGWGLTYTITFIINYTAAVKESLCLILKARRGGFQCRFYICTCFEIDNKIILYCP